jgi:quercetin 2,3-dioxygenase
VGSRAKPMSRPRTTDPLVVTDTVPVTSADPPTCLVQRSAARFLTLAPGRATRHAFSFGVHYDPDNVGFGPLLVCNDDRVGAGCGYDAHPHRDVEIVTWVVTGSLRHTDTLGRTGIVYPGLVQRMSAGAGIVHSERNDAFLLDPRRSAEPLRFVQMWLRADEPGGEAGYEQRDVDLAALDHGWLPIASGEEVDAAVGLGTAGATLWATRLAPGQRRALPAADLVFLQVVLGRVDLSRDGAVAAGDTVRVRGRSDMEAIGVRAAELLVWTLPAERLAEGDPAGVRLGDR